jgi:hypothetical protein
VEFIDNEGRGWYGIIERVEPEHYQIFSNGEIYFVGHSNTKKRV